MPSFISVFRSAKPPTVVDHSKHPVGDAKKWKTDSVDIQSPPINMLRSMLSSSSRRSGVMRFRKQILGPRSLDSYSRREFSDATLLNLSRIPRKPEEPPEPESPWPKILIGGMAVGIASVAAYQVSMKYSEKASHEGKHNSLGANMASFEDRDRTTVVDAKGLVHLDEEKSSSTVEVLDDVVKGMDDTVKSDISSGLSISGELEGSANEEAYVAPHKFYRTIEDDNASDQQNILPLSAMVSEDQSRYLSSSSEIEQDRLRSSATANTSSRNKAVVDQSSMSLNQENGEHEIPTSHKNIVSEDRLEDSIGEEIGMGTSLLEAYNLEEKSQDNPSAPLHGSEGKEVLATAFQELNEAAITKDGRLILDFLQAIHGAEKRQADLDSHLFVEEKRALKEKYEKELKDAIARELMHAEEAALLNKELKKERAKAAVALKALQQSLEDGHKLELAQKAAEAESKLKKVEELAKLEMATTIAKEKAAQIENVAEVNLHINALRMAFFARSEEARQNHSIHKLALGALALEDALDKGLPIKAEIEALQSYLQGIEKDSVLDLVLSSLPEETILHGTETVLQLNQQFDTLKGTLRLFSLIPPGGGGILAHSLAYAASWIKIKGASQSGDDIESTIQKVEYLLAEGNLADAAAALEEGVEGSQTDEIVGAWVNRVRNRAIAEQALTLLQSFASSASLT